eukprot:288299_1
MHKYCDLSSHEDENIQILPGIEDASYEDDIINPMINKTKNLKPGVEYSTHKHLSLSFNLRGLMDVKISKEMHQSISEDIEITDISMAPLLQPHSCYFNYQTTKGYPSIKIQVTNIADPLVANYWSPYNFKNQDIVTRTTKCDCLLRQAGSNPTDVIIYKCCGPKYCNNNKCKYYIELPNNKPEFNNTSKHKTSKHKYCKGINIGTHELSIDECENLMILLRNECMFGLDYGLIVKINNHCEKCNYIADYKCRFSIFSMFSRTINPFTLLKPKQIGNQPIPHPRYPTKIPHTFCEWSPYHSAPRRIESFRKERKTNALRKMGCKPLKAGGKSFNGLYVFKYEIPEGFKQNVIYAEINDVQSVVVTTDQETMHIVAESVANRHVINNNINPEATAILLETESSFAHQIIPSYCTTDATYKIGQNHGYSVIDNMSLIESMESKFGQILMDCVLPFLYTLTAATDNMVAYMVDMGFIIKGFEEAMPHKQTLIRNIIFTADLCSKMRAGFLVALDLIILDKWDN